MNNSVESKSFLPQLLSRGAIVAALVLSSTGCDTAKGIKQDLGGMWGAAGDMLGGPLDAVAGVLRLGKGTFDLLNNSLSLVRRPIEALPGQNTRTGDKTSALEPVNRGKLASAAPNKPEPTQSLGAGRQMASLALQDAKGGDKYDIKLGDRVVGYANAQGSFDEERQLLYSYKMGQTEVIITGLDGTNFGAITDPDLVRQTAASKGATPSKEVVEACTVTKETAITPTEKRMAYLVNIGILASTLQGSEELQRRLAKEKPEVQDKHTTLAHIMGSVCQSVWKTYGWTAG